MPYQEADFALMKAHIKILLQTRLPCLRPLKRLIEAQESVQVAQNDLAALISATIKSSVSSNQNDLGELLSALENLAKI